MDIVTIGVFLFLTFVVGYVIVHRRVDKLRLEFERSMRNMYGNLTDLAGKYKSLRQDIRGNNNSISCLDEYLRDCYSRINDIKKDIFELNSPAKYKLLSNIERDGKSYTITSIETKVDYTKTHDLFSVGGRKINVKEYKRVYTLKHVDPTETLTLREDEI